MHCGAATASAAAAATAAVEAAVAAAVATAAAARPPSLAHVDKNYEPSDWLLLANTRHSHQH